MTRICPNTACSDRIGLGFTAEYVDSVEVCPSCGARLIEGTSTELRTRRPRPRVPDVDMVCVLRTGDEALAALAKSLLESENIAYVVKGEGLQDLLGWGRLGGGFNYVVGPAEFLVAEADADRARALLRSEGTVVDPPLPEDDA